MAPKLLPDEDRRFSPFCTAESFQEQYAPSGLDAARGPAEIVSAALDMLFADVRHDPDGWSQLVQLASVAAAAQKLPRSVVEKAQQIDYFRDQQRFQEIVDQVRAALAKLPTDALKELAAGMIHEDERPPMQYSAASDDAHRNGVAPMRFRIKSVLLENEARSRKRGGR